VTDKDRIGKNTDAAERACSILEDFRIVGISRLLIPRASGNSTRYTLNQFLLILILMSDEFSLN
jgi:hypothetical protein